MVKRINILLTAVMLVMILPAAYSLNYRPSQRYEMSGDLGIYFTNVDAVVEKVRQGLHDHSEKITVTYNSHYDNMEKIPEIVRLLVDHALEETDDPTEGDYIYHQYGGYEYSYKYSQSDGIYRYIIEIVPEYYTYLNQEKEVDDRINKLIDSFDEQENAEGDDQEIEDHLQEITVGDDGYAHGFDFIHRHVHQI